MLKNSEPARATATVASPATIARVGAHKTAERRQVGASSPLARRLSRPVGRIAHAWIVGPARARPVTGWAAVETSGPWTGG